MVSNALSIRRTILPRPKVCKTLPPPPPPPTGLFWDKFNDAPGTPLFIHTPDVDKLGGGWIERNGIFIVEGTNVRVVPGTPKPRTVYHADVGRETVIIYALIYTGDGGVFTIGIAFNLGPGGGFHLIDVFVGGKQIRYMTWNDPNYQVAQQWTEPSLAPATRFLITVRFHPTHNTCQLDDGVEHFLWTGVASGRTTFGIMSHDNQSIRHEEFRVEPYSP